MPPNRLGTLERKSPSRDHLLDHVARDMTQLVELLAALCDLGNDGVERDICGGIHQSRSTAASRATSTLTLAWPSLQLCWRRRPQENDIGVTLRCAKPIVRTCLSSRGVSVVPAGLQGSRRTRARRGNMRGGAAMFPRCCRAFVRGGTSSSEATVGPGTAELPRRPLPREVVLWSQAHSPPNAAALSSWFLI